MASQVHDRGALILHDGTATWKQAAAAAIKFLLTTSSYTPNKNTHNFVSSVTNELSTAGGSNYVRKSTTGRTSTQFSGGVMLDLTDVTMTALGATAGTPKYAVFFLDSGSDATSEIIGSVDLGSAPTPDGSNYLITWDALGAFRLTT